MDRLALLRTWRYCLNLTCFCSCWQREASVRTAASNGLLFTLHMMYGGGEPRLNDIGRGQPKNADKILPQSDIIHHKFHAV
jgi:hypothetical protein